ncbi:hypothetical protein KIPB_005967 [Kipferlia bialata]|uniref:Uncharacterized protein n=1 Tax=Kipferlia bialata TaxID=797122 RepID=A0A9K3CXS8_9EUKA|nr:hypothetical protein KIPB_005967 [Kipferlia bialata]|eukprot:g5967.t1
MSTTGRESGIGSLLDEAGGHLEQSGTHVASGRVTTLLDNAEGSLESVGSIRRMSSSSPSTGYGTRPNTMPGGTRRMRKEQQEREERVGTLMDDPSDVSSLDASEFEDSIVDSVPESHAVPIRVVDDTVVEDLASESDLSDDSDQGYDAVGVSVLSDGGQGVLSDAEGEGPGAESIVADGPSVAEDVDDDGEMHDSEGLEEDSVELSDSGIESDRARPVVDEAMEVSDAESPVHAYHNQTEIGGRISPEHESQRVTEIGGRISPDTLSDAEASHPDAALSPSPTTPARVVASTPSKTTRQPAPSHEPHPPSEGMGEAHQGRPMHRHPSHVAFSPVTSVHTEDTASAGLGEPLSPIEPVSLTRDKAGTGAGTEGMGGRGDRHTHRPEHVNIPAAAAASPPSPLPPTPHGPEPLEGEDSISPVLVEARPVTSGGSRGQLGRRRHSRSSGGIQHVNIPMTQTRDALPPSSPLADLRMEARQREREGEGESVGEGDGYYESPSVLPPREYHSPSSAKGTPRRRLDQSATEPGSGVPVPPLSLSIGAREMRIHNRGIFAASTQSARLDGSQGYGACTDRVSHTARHQREREGPPSVAGSRSARQRERGSSRHRSRREGRVPRPAPAQWDGHTGKSSVRPYDPLADTHCSHVLGDRTVETAMRSGAISDEALYVLNLRRVWAGMPAVTARDETRSASHSVRERERGRERRASERRGAERSLTQSHSQGQRGRGSTRSLPHPPAARPPNTTKPRQLRLSRAAAHHERDYHERAKQRVREKTRVSPSPYALEPRLRMSLGSKQRHKRRGRKARSTGSSSSTLSHPAPSQTKLESVDIDTFSSAYHFPIPDKWALPASDESGQGGARVECVPDGSKTAIQRMSSHSLDVALARLSRDSMGGHVYTGTQLPSVTRQRNRRRQRAGAML